MSELPVVNIYTDGACHGNPGPGGYGVILATRERRKELTGGFRRTTNNRMELLAAITGLEALLKPCRVTLYSDSRYVVDGISKGWARRWRARGWMRTPQDPAINADLWARLLDVIAKHEVEFEWVRGHAGHAENERCDQLSVQAARGKNLPADAGYEQPSRPGASPTLLA